MLFLAGQILPVYAGWLRMVGRMGTLVIIWQRQQHFETEAMKINMATATTLCNISTQEIIWLRQQHFDQYGKGNDTL